MNLSILISLLLFVLVGVNLVWRMASRQRSMPCPTLFAGFLESAWMERIMGTQETLDRLGLRSGQRVLEVGPGPGRLLIPAAKRVLPDGEVFGLDIQPGMINRLEARAAHAGLSNLTAVLGDATQPHFPSKSFDMVFLCTVLGEIPDREAAFRQCRAVLKPGGTLSITEVFPDPHFQTRVTVQQLAEAVGLRLIEVHGPWYFFTANFTKEGEAI